jgi:hypothetical protein
MANFNGADGNRKEGNVLSPQKLVFGICYLGLPFGLAFITHTGAGITAGVDL